MLHHISIISQKLTAPLCTGLGGMLSDVSPRRIGIFDLIGVEVKCGHNITIEG